MKTFLLTTLILSSVFADYKDTKSLYHDTSKGVHQSISLHNVKAEPAEVITSTKIRRVPRYSYYNVYKTRTVWKCLPNGGSVTPLPPVKISWLGSWISGFSGTKNPIKKGWKVKSPNYCQQGDLVKFTNPCGKTKSIRAGKTTFFGGAKIDWYASGFVNCPVYIGKGSCTK